MSEATDYSADEIIEPERFFTVEDPISEPSEMVSSIAPKWHISGTFRLELGIYADDPSEAMRHLMDALEELGAYERVNGPIKIRQVYGV